MKNKTTQIKNSLFSLIIVSIILSCSKNVSSPTSNNAVPSVYAKIYGATSITNDGTYIIIKTNGTPDHKSPYYATNSALYEVFTGITFGGNTFVKNPNTIASQSLPLKFR